MAVPLIAAGIGAAATIGGGLMAASANKKAMAQQKAMQDAALSIANNLQIPTADAQKLILTDPEMVWDFIPEETKAILQEQSEYAKIEEDPRLKDAQMSALEGLQARAESEGLTPDEVAQFQQLRRDVSQQTEAKDARILQSLAERGMLGSGQELAMRRANTQADMLAQSEQSDRLAQNAIMAKMAALQGMGTLGGEIRGQEFDMAAKKANAQDLINQFNAQNQQNVLNYNVQNRNAAELQRQNMLQALNEQTTANRNTEAQWKAELPQKQYQNQLDKAKMQMSAYGAGADLAGKQGASQASMYQGVGSGLAGVMSAAGDMYAKMNSKSAPKTTSTSSSDEWDSSGNYNRA